MRDAIDDLAELTLDVREVVRLAEIVGPMMRTCPLSSFLTGDRTLTNMRG